MILTYSLPVNSLRRRRGNSTGADTNNSAPASLPVDPYERLRLLYPTYVRAPFAEHHRAFWEWESSIEPGIRADPFVGIWARGGAKSTSAELACVDLGARSKRRYCLYVSGTQSQADDHVGTVGVMMESPELAKYVPAMGERRTGKFGNSKAWRRERLWTAHGFVVDALGLDTAARGAKLEEQRPDLLILDDIDDTGDTGETTRKKIEDITQKLIPAGSEDVVILAIQNLVIPNGVFAQLADGRADWLARRIVSGPIPALEALMYETRDGRHFITHGVPTWEGQDIHRCQAMLDGMGLLAFLSECQHEVERTGSPLVYGVGSDGVLIFDKRLNVRPHPFAWTDCKWKVVAIDQGGRDPSAMTVMGVSGDERMHIFNEKRWEGLVPASTYAERINKLGRVDVIAIDPSAQSLIATLRDDYGLPAIAANNDRAFGISQVQEAFRSRRLTIAESCEWLQREIASYWFKERPEGGGSVSSFETRTGAGHHGDLCDCVRYGVMAVYDGFPRISVRNYKVNAPAAGVTARI